MNEAQTIPPPQADFVRRVLFLVAVICLGYAIVTLAISVPDVLKVAPTLRWRIGRIDAALMVLLIATQAMLLLGALALLGKRRTGAVLLIIWAITFMSLRLAMAASIYHHYLVFFSRTKSAVPSPALTASRMFLGWLEHCAFPALVCAILLQRDVRECWARKAGGGFEVIPMAEMVPTPAAREDHDEPTL